MDTPQNFNVELAALSEAIASEQTIIAGETHAAPASDKDKIHAALKEQIGELLPSSAGASATDPATQVPLPTVAPAQVKKAGSGGKSYLDAVDDATVAKVNGYIAKVFSNGIQATLREVIEQDPFVLDVFHDALTDKLYGELKARGLAK